MTQKNLFILVMSGIIAMITGLAISPTAVAIIILVAGILASVGLFIALIWHLCGLYAKDY